MIAKLAIDAEAIPNFTWTNGLLRYKGMIWIGSNQVLQLKVISAMHDSALGHFGVPVTYKRLKQHFAWNGMKVIVTDYV
jgi:hypothetical protein